MDQKKIGTILKYCFHLSRLVSPREAEEYGLHDLDGAVCDFLNEVSNAVLEGKELDIEGDEFYSEVYERMRSSLSEIYEEEF